MTQELKQKTLMKTKKIASGSFLYHPIHGICRVDRVIQQEHAGKKALTYSLVPKISNRMKMRFVIAAAEMEISGFHDLVSVKEANDILEYLKTGDNKMVQTRPTWLLAQSILSFCCEDLLVGKQRKLQVLRDSVRGLTGELACVFKVNLKEAVEMIKKNLKAQHLKNVSVIAALENAADD